MIKPNSYRANCKTRPYLAHAEISNRMLYNKIQHGMNKT